MITVGRKCALIFYSIDFYVCDRSNAGECTCLCEVSFGVADLHVDELIHSLVFSLRGRAGRNQSPVM